MHNVVNGLKHSKSSVWPFLNVEFGLLKITHGALNAATIRSKCIFDTLFNTVKRIQTTQLCSVE